MRRATICGDPDRTGHRVAGIGEQTIMNTKIITETAQKTLDGSLWFPEVVGKLLAAGVEYYHVDYVGLRKRFYSAEGGMVATSINYEGLPPVAPEFDAAALRANILDSQRHGQPYREFTRRAIAGGVQGILPFARQTRHLLGPHRRPAHGMVPRGSNRIGHLGPSRTASPCGRPPLVKP